MRERRRCWLGECVATQAGRVDPEDRAALLVVPAAEVVAPLVVAAEVPRLAVAENRADVVTRAARAAVAEDSAAVEEICNNSWIGRPSYRWPN